MNKSDTSKFDWAALFLNTKVITDVRDTKKDTSGAFGTKEGERILALGRGTARGLDTSKAYIILYQRRVSLAPKVCCWYHVPQFFFAFTRVSTLGNSAENESPHEYPPFVYKPVGHTLPSAENTVYISHPFSVHLLTCFCEVVAVPPAPQKIRPTVTTIVICGGNTSHRKMPKLKDQVSVAPAC